MYVYFMHIVYMYIYFMYIVYTYNNKECAEKISKWSFKINVQLLKYVLSNHRTTPTLER